VATLRVVHEEVGSAKSCRTYNHDAYAWACKLQLLAFEETFTMDYKEEEAKWHLRVDRIRQTAPSEEE
jgi:hypothetical protein